MGKGFHWPSYGPSEDAKRGDDPTYVCPELTRVYNDRDRFFLRRSMSMISTVKVEIGEFRGW